MAMTYREWLENHVAYVGEDCTKVNKIKRNYRCSNFFTYKVTKDEVLTYLSDGGAESELDIDLSSYERVGLYLQYPDTNCINDTIIQGHNLSTLTITYSIQPNVYCMGFNKTTKLPENIRLQNVFLSHVITDYADPEKENIVYDSNKHSIAQFFVTTPATTSSFTGDFNFLAEYNIIDLEYILDK